jgi:signal recognition particle GTPase
MGSGRTEEEVQELIAMFTSMRMQMQTMSRMMALSGGGQGEAGAREGGSSSWEHGPRCLPP